MAVPVEKRIALAKNEHIPKRRIGAHRSHCHLNKFVRRFLATRINSRAAPALARSDGQQAAFAKRTKQRMPCAWSGLETACLPKGDFDDEIVLFSYLSNDSSWSILQGNFNFRPFPSCQTVHSSMKCQ